MKYERYVYLLLIVFLIGCLFYFTQCNGTRTQPQSQTTVASKCDTIKEVVTDTFYSEAAIPKPKIEIQEIIVAVVDTFVEIEFVQVPVERIVFIEKEVPVLVYDSVFQHANYSLHWTIENFTDGRLKSFSHFINWKYSQNQTNNYSTREIPRKYYIQYLFGLNINRSNIIHGVGFGREWRRFSAGVVGLREFEAKESSILLTGKIKF